MMLPITGVPDRDSICRALEIACRSFSISSSSSLSDLPEVNPGHIRTGLYDEADHEAVRKRIERAEKVVQSFEVNDRGMPDKGFQEMYEI